MSKLVGTIAFGLLLTLAADAQAQRLFGRNRQYTQAQQAQAQPTQAQGQPAGQAAFQPSPQTDAQIAGMLNVGNHVEIALSEFAEQKSGNAEVKKLAGEMIKEHTQFTEQLNRFANAGGANVAAPAQPAGQHLPMLQIGQQIGEQCIQSGKRELQEKRGAEFDKCFSGLQLGAHMATIDKMHVLRSYASPQLQQVLAQGEQTAQHHFDQWKQFMQQAEKDNTSANRNP